MKRFVLAAALACLAAPALADVTYTYTGQPLPTVDPTPFPPLTIVLDFTSDGSALLDWSVSEPEFGTIDAANVFTLTSDGVTQTPAIYLYTDASGAVTSWFVNVAVRSPTSPPGKNFLTPWAQSFYGVVPASATLPEGTYAADGIPGGFNMNAPGTWTASGGVLADFGLGDRADLRTLATPIPEPAPALLLLAGGAALVMLRRPRAAGARA